MQQQSEKIVTCKKCGNKIAITSVVLHYKDCGKKIEQNPPEENSINLEQNTNEIFKQSQNIQVEGVQEKKQPQQQKINVEKQNNPEQKQQENGQYTKCNLCLKLLYSYQIEAHQDECEELLRLQTQQIADSEEVFPNNFQETQPEDFPSQRTQEFQSVLDDGTIRQTRIKRDNLTNFTHYQTCFKNSNNVPLNQFLRNLGNQVPSFLPQQKQEDSDNSENEAKQVNHENDEFDENTEPYVLAKFEFKESPELSEENKKCSICLSEFKIGDELTALPCFHRFHDDCSVNWFREKQQLICPICKFEINDQGFQDF